MEAASSLEIMETEEVVTELTFKKTIDGNVTWQGHCQLPPQPRMMSPACQHQQQVLSDLERFTSKAKL